MAYFDTFTANLFRTDSAGRRVIAPFGRSVYAVSGDDEARIKRAVTAFYGVMLVTIVSSVVTVDWRWTLFLLVPAFTAAFLGLMAWLVTSLEPLEITAADLPPLRPAQAFDAAARATGRTTLWVLTAGSSMMTAASIWASIMTRGRLWWTAALFALCTAVFGVQLRRAR